MRNREQTLLSVSYSRRVATNRPHNRSIGAAFRTDRPVPFKQCCKDTCSHSVVTLGFLFVSLDCFAVLFFFSDFCLFPSRFFILFLTWIFYWSVLRFFITRFSSSSADACSVQTGRLTLLTRGVGSGTATKGGAGWLNSA